MTHSNSQNSVSVRLEAGTYWLCSCGLSKNFPYCDGGHKGTSFQPLALELDHSQVVEITK
jgi:CDGSH iron-sulfur domain-containing protein 3